MFGKTYYWGVGDTEDGRHVLAGPYGSKDEARNRTQMQGVRMPTVYRLNTASRDAAGPKIRALMAAKDGAHVDDVMRPFRHGPEPEPEPTAPAVSVPGANPEPKRGLFE